MTTHFVAGSRLERGEVECPVNIEQIAANDVDSGTELWQTDRTAAGRLRLGDINPGAADSWPRYLTNVGDRLFLSAVQADAGRELWAVDLAVCPGDCNYDAVTGIDELLRGVDMPLSNGARYTCTALDQEHDGQGTVDGLVAAVNAALDGCS